MWRTALFFPEVEEGILEGIREDPELNTRRLGKDLRVFKDVVHGVLKEQLVYQFQKMLVQNLSHYNPEMRLMF